MAIVVITSKYTIAFRPMRPTSAVSVSLPMPTTTVMKMIGAIIMRTSLTNPSPNGCMATAMCGKKRPSSTPATIAISTWM